MRLAKYKLNVDNNFYDSSAYFYNNADLSTDLRLLSMRKYFYFARNFQLNYLYLTAGLICSSQ